VCDLSVSKVNQDMVHLLMRNHRLSQVQHTTRSCGGTIDSSCPRVALQGHQQSFIHMQTTTTRHTVFQSTYFKFDIEYVLFTTHFLDMYSLHISVFVCTYQYVCVCVYVCMYICLYIFVCMVCILRVLSLCMCVYYMYHYVLSSIVYNTLYIALLHHPAYTCHNVHILIILPVLLQTYTYTYLPIWNPFFPPLLVVEIFPQALNPKS
jgi:hypothetical protein